ncbi:MAG: polyprenyl synthetase family protein [Myxococcales bacterium]|nr:polyprenyl synthetase family protein [Myxococcales bacterium]
MPYIPTTPPVVDTLIREYGELARQAMIDFLPRREPRRYLYDLVDEYPRRGGRLLRPTLCIASACAHGATVDEAMKCAISVELLHNGLLVVDDIQDESEERRGLPSLHSQWGVPLAINVGSTMTVLSLIPLLESVNTCGPFVALRVVDEAVRAAQACAEGQALELGWRLDNRVDITESEYLDMVTRKTCSYSTMFPIHAGALIGTRAAEIEPALLHYAHCLGAAFQIQDDLLNIDGDHVRYGKEIGGDLLEGKRTLLTIELLRRCTAPERAFVTTFLGTPRASKSPGDLRRIVGMLRAYECPAFARRFAQNLLGAASYALEHDAARLTPSRDLDFLRGILPWVVEQPQQVGHA